MTADFSGENFPLPPGISEGPRLLDPPADALGPELTVGGRTILPTEIRQALVVSHPNRFGVAQDLNRLAALAEGAPIYVRLDPILIDQCVLPFPLVSLVEWPLRDPGPRQRAGWRTRLAADFLRRRLRQVRGLRFMSPSQAGGAVALILAVPAREVVSQVEVAGARVLACGPWEGCIVVTCGWWHTRAQLAAVADAIGAVLEGKSLQPIPEDRYDRLPNDLAWRQLDSIQAPEHEEMV
ncbi:MAG: hypothetical protein ACRDWA_14770 [Acidimicrobiia bacterium]